jgi:serine protease
MRALGVRPMSDATGRPVLAHLERAGVQLRQPSAGAGADRAAAMADQVRRKHETLLTIKSLRRETSVAYAQPNYRVEAQASPNDEFYHLQWHYPMIDLPAAWDVTFGDAAVRVAVIDTGMLTGHPDLAGQLEPGYDFISDASRSADGDGIDPDPNDEGDGDDVQASSFHGTHVAGTVAAATDNGIGVAGVAPGVRMVPVRVLGVGGGTSYDVIQGVRFAAGVVNDSGIIRPPVDVMNLSLGRLGPCTQAEQAAFEVARAQGVVVVVAAGNDNLDAAQAYPANCHGVIAVGAVDLLGDRSYYSNFGSLVDVQAPGGDRTVDRNGDGYGDGILSTKGDERADPPDFVYTFAQGTSMATPHVAGVVALMKSVNPALTPDAVDQLLAHGAMTDNRGVINAHSAVYAALDAAGAPPALDPTLTVSPTSLNFASAFTHAEIDVRVAGGGSLQAGVPAASEPWLSVAPVGVTADNLGRYSVSVDRSSLAEGTHTATISVDSDVNTVEIPVIMQVSGAAVDADAGRLYVLLIDGSTGDVSDVVETDAAAGIYGYEFPAVDPGDYEIVAGTDLDHDLFICDAGERCGVYPTLDHWGVPFAVEGDLSGLDFSVGDVIPISGADLESTAPPAVRVGAPEPRKRVGLEQN